MYEGQLMQLQQQTFNMEQAAMTTENLKNTVRHRAHFTLSGPPEGRNAMAWPDLQSFSSSKAS